MQMFVSSVFHYSRTCLPWEESCPSGVLSNQISAESRALLALCCLYLQIDYMQSAVLQGDSISVSEPLRTETYRCTRDLLCPAANWRIFR